MQATGTDPDHPLTEEAAAGTDVPAAAQKAAKLRESEERTDDPEAAPDSFLEHRTSDEATPPS